MVEGCLLDLSLYLEFQLFEFVYDFVQVASTCIVVEPASLACTASSMCGFSDSLPFEQFCFNLSVFGCTTQAISILIAIVFLSPLPTFRAGPAVFLVKFHIRPSIV